MHPTNSMAKITRPKNLVPASQQLNVKPRQHNTNHTDGEGFQVPTHHSEYFSNGPHRTNFLCRTPSQGTPSPTPPTSSLPKNSLNTSLPNRARSNPNSNVLLQKNSSLTSSFSSQHSLLKRNNSLQQSNFQKIYNQQSENISLKSPTDSPSSFSDQQEKKKASPESQAQSGSLMIDISQASSSTKADTEMKDVDGKSNEGTIPLPSTNQQSFDFPDEDWFLSSFAFDSLMANGKSMPLSTQSSTADSLPTPNSSSSNSKLQLSPILSVGTDSQTLLTNLSATQDENKSLKSRILELEREMDNVKHKISLPQTPKTDIILQKRMENLESQIKFKEKELEDVESTKNNIAEQLNQQQKIIAKLRNQLNATNHLNTSSSSSTLSASAYDIKTSNLPISQAPIVNTVSPIPSMNSSTMTSMMVNVDPSEMGTKTKKEQEEVDPIKKGNLPEIPRLQGRSSGWTWLFNGQTLKRLFYSNQSGLFALLTPQHSTPSVVLNSTSALISSGNNDKTEETVSFDMEDKQVAEELAFELQECVSRYTKQEASDDVLLPTLHKFFQHSIQHKKGSLLHNCLEVLEILTSASPLTRQALLGPPTSSDEDKTIPLNQDETPKTNFVGHKSFKNSRIVTYAINSPTSSRRNGQKTDSAVEKEKEKENVQRKRKYDYEFETEQREDYPFSCSPCPPLSSPSSRASALAFFSDLMKFVREYTCSSADQQLDLPALNRILSIMITLVSVSPASLLSPKFDCLLTPEVMGELLNKDQPIASKEKALDLLLALLRSETLFALAQKNRVFDLVDKFLTSKTHGSTSQVRNLRRKTVRLFTLVAVSYVNGLEKSQRLSQDVTISQMMPFPPSAEAALLLQDESLTLAATAENLISRLILLLHNELDELSPLLSIPERKCSLKLIRESVQLLLLVGHLDDFSYLTALRHSFLSVTMRLIDASRSPLARNNRKTTTPTTILPSTQASDESNSSFEQDGQQTESLLKKLGEEAVALRQLLAVSDENVFCSLSGQPAASSSKPHRISDVNFARSQSQRPR
eukprot:TRINITY_DN9886_c0_g1_i1.p1 TRINITY_DN9886_c0_g1~~TRINITY_DN9886_c0_g1_i1.p1  ORF type:complete len:1045 (+),score=310.22 TRINITY_DN9886_c0_g1_i1:31-3135(+)